MATKMIAVLLVFTFGGIKLDELISTEFKWFTMFGALIGSGLAIYSVIKDLTK